MRKFDGATGRPVSGPYGCVAGNAPEIRRAAWRGGPYKIIRKIIGNSWAAEGGGPYGGER